MDPLNAGNRFMLRLLRGAGVQDTKDLGLDDISLPKVMRILTMVLTCCLLLVVIYIFRNDTPDQVSRPQLWNSVVGTLVILCAIVQSFGFIAAYDVDLAMIKSYCELSFVAIILAALAAFIRCLYNFRRGYSVILSCVLKAEQLWKAAGSKYTTTSDYGRQVRSREKQCEDSRNQMMMIEYGCMLAIIGMSILVDLLARKLVLQLSAEAREGESQAHQDPSSPATVRNSSVARGSQEAVNAPPPYTPRPAINSTQTLGALGLPPIDTARPRSSYTHPRSGESF